MIPSALVWFVDLCCVYKHAPAEARSLGRDLCKQFSSKDNRKQINRVFKRHNSSLDKIIGWLDSENFSASIKKTSSNLALATHKSSVDAIKKINAGGVASESWNMGARRGCDIDFSATMEAAALASYLTKIWLHDALPSKIYHLEEDLAEEYLLIAHIFNIRKYEKIYLFNSAAAIAISSNLFKVNPDNIRKYTIIGAGDSQSEACMALFALSSRGLLQKADLYFDVEELIIAGLGSEL